MSDEGESDVDSQTSDVDDRYDADTSSQGSRGSSDDVGESAGEVENDLGDQTIPAGDADKDENASETRKRSDLVSTSDRAVEEEDDRQSGGISRVGSGRGESRTSNPMLGGEEAHAARMGERVRPSSASSRESGRDLVLEDDQVDGREGGSDDRSENDATGSYDGDNDEEDIVEPCLGEEEGNYDGEKPPVPPLEINVFSGSSFDADADEGMSRRGSMASISADGERSSLASGSLCLRPPSSESDRRFLEVRPTSQASNADRHASGSSQSDVSERHKGERSQSVTQSSHRVEEHASSTERNASGSSQSDVSEPPDGKGSQNDTHDSHREGEERERPDVEENLDHQRPPSRRSESLSYQSRPSSAGSEGGRRKRKTGSRNSLRSDEGSGSRPPSTSVRTPSIGNKGGSSKRKTGSRTSLRSDKEGGSRTPSVSESNTASLRPPSSGSERRSNTSSMTSLRKDKEGESRRPTTPESNTASLRPPSAGSERRSNTGSRTSLRSNKEGDSRRPSVVESNTASLRSSSVKSTTSKMDARPDSVASGRVSIKSLPLGRNVDRPTVTRPKSADIRGRHAKMDRSRENAEEEDKTSQTERGEDDIVQDKSREHDTDTHHSRRSLHSAMSTKSFRSIASTRYDYLAELSDIKERLESKAEEWEGLAEENLEVFFEELRELYGRTTAVLRNSHRDSICLMERIVQVRKLLKETRRKLRDETSDRSLSGLEEKDPGPSRRLSLTVQQARATLARAVAEAAEAERSAAAAEVAAAEAAAAAGRSMAGPETKSTDEVDGAVSTEGDDVTDRTEETTSDKDITMATAEGDKDKEEINTEGDGKGENEGENEEVKKEERNESNEDEKEEKPENGENVENVPETDEKDDTPAAENTGNEGETEERDHPLDETVDAVTEEQKVTEEKEETTEENKQDSEENKETNEESDERVETRSSKLEDIQEDEAPENNKENSAEKTKESSNAGSPLTRRSSMPSLTSPRGSPGASQQAVQRRGSLMDVRLRQAEKAQKDAMKDPNNWPMEVLQVENLDGEHEVACLNRAVSDVLDSADSGISASYMHQLSHLTVGSGEELVSEVVEVHPRGHTLPGPMIVAVPYPVSARAGSREVIVKTSQDGEKWRAVPTFNPEASYRERKGVLFAEVKVNQLGMYAVLSRPAREKIHIPTKGGLFKAPQDQRVSFKYAKEGLKTSMVLTLEIQPVSMAVVADVRSRERACEGLISCSPIVRMSHSVVINSRDAAPITVTVPVPPNPSRAAAEESNTSRRPKTAFEGSRSSDAASRPMSAFSLGTRSTSAQEEDDQLRLMCWEDGGWSARDDVELMERKGDLVAFEMKGVLQRFIILRLKTGSHFSSEKVVRALEKSLRTKRASCIAQHRADDPNSLVFKCVPVADSANTLRALEDAGYVGPPDPSADVLLTEGQVVYMRLLGNLTQADASSEEELRLPFHCHVHKSVRLKVKERDEFANHSYDEYRGQVEFFLRENNVHDGKETSLCKLPLTLPKKERPRPRPPSSYRKLIEVPGPLGTEGLDHLAREMGEDWDIVAGYLKLKHSRVQAIKRNYPGDIKQQAFDMLYTWRNSMPRHCDKVTVLYKALRKSDRGDLAEKLRAQAAA